MYHKVFLRTKAFGPWDWPALCNTGKVRAAELSWHMGPGCGYKRPEGTLAVYSMHEPAMPSAIKKVQKLFGGGVGRGAPGPGSRLKEAEPKGPLPSGEQHLPPTVLILAPLAPPYHHPHLRSAEEVRSQGKRLVGRGAACGEEMRMQDCGPAPGGPQMLAQIETWPAAPLGKPCCS